jgi:hypothetical protein
MDLPVFATGLGTPRPFECAWCFDPSIETATIMLTGQEPAELQLCRKHFDELLACAQSAR